MVNSLWSKSPIIPKKNYSVLSSEAKAILSQDLLARQLVGWIYNQDGYTSFHGRPDSIPLVDVCNDPVDPEVISRTLQELEKAGLTVLTQDNRGQELWGFSRECFSDRSMTSGDV